MRQRERESEIETETKISERENVIQLTLNKSNLI